jgi:copper chaperone CopZ
MESVIFSVPKMYADHHVLAIREAILSLGGVMEVTASSVSKMVQVRYDPDAVTPTAIEEGLRGAGYGPGEDCELHKEPEAKVDEFPWFKSIWGVTQTNILEREMSGDFRKY